MAAIVWEQQLIYVKAEVTGCTQTQQNSHLPYDVQQLLPVTVATSFYLSTQFTCSNCCFWKQVISFLSDKPTICGSPVNNLRSRRQ